MPHHQPYQPALVTDQRRVGGLAVFGGIVLAVLTLFYMLPTSVAVWRGRSNAGAIAVLNLLLGWTFLGWLAALVMACMPHALAGTTAPTQVLPAPPGWYAAGGSMRWWDGQRWT
jgi:hypothetical protein